MYEIRKSRDLAHRMGGKWFTQGTKQEESP